MSSKHQVVIPAGISKKLMITKGTRVRIGEKNGSVIMRPVPKLSDLIGIDKGLHLSKDLKRMRKEDMKLETADQSD